MNDKKSISEQIKDRIQSSFPDTPAEIKNNSYLHKGHAGDDGSGETHFKIILKKDAFLSLAPLQRHRLVLNALGKDLIASIHSLEIKFSD